LAAGITTDAQKKIPPDTKVDLPILEKGARETPNDPLIYYALALCYAGDNPSAMLAAMEKAYSLSPKDPGIAVMYVVALQMNKEPLKALEVDKQVTAMLPDSYVLKCGLAALEIAIQEYTEATTLIEAVLRKDAVELVPQDKCLLLSMIGTCLLYAGKHADAVAKLQEAVTGYPGLGTAQATLGEAYLKSGRVEKARAALDKALALNPNYPKALYYMGVALELSGDFRKAQETFQSAYKCGRGNLANSGDDYYLLYQICEKLGKKEEGEKYKEEAAKLLFTYEAPWGESKRSAVRKRNKCLRERIKCRAIDAGSSRERPRFQR
jgi:Flp pilus assembly protein TadD